MIYKNGIKEYAIMCCSCGLAYGFSMGLFYEDVTMGLIAGILFGVLFTLCMAIFSKHTEKKSAHLRAEILKVRKIICEGPANHKKGANALSLLSTNL